ncbi:MAG: tetratricopeptide repeat protein [Akkermansiaceae bacterium]
MKSISIIITAGLIAVLPSVVTADEASPLVVAKQKAPRTLAEISLSKQPATIKLTLTTGAKKGQPFSGAFISNDGLALVDLTSLAWEKLPAATTWDETKIKFEKILGIFPEPELALVKFNHRPKVWLTLSNKKPAVGESLAMVFTQKQNKVAYRRSEGDVPPVVGQVMTQRTTVTSSNLKGQFFHTILSLGCSPTRKQRDQFAPGVFAINSDGGLVAVSGGLGLADNGQTLITLPPITHLFDKIRQLADGQQAISRDEIKKHIDITLVDNDFRSLHLAEASGNNAEARSRLTILIKKYPQNNFLKQLAIMHDLRNDQGAPIITIEDFQPDPKSSRARQITTLTARAKILVQKQDRQGAIRALEKAIQLSPEDYPDARLMLAYIYMQSRRLDEAKPLLLKVYPLTDDHISVTGTLESIMIKERKIDEADKYSKRLYQLYKIYRR